MGQVRGVLFCDAGSCERNSTATLPAGRPVGGTAAQDVSGVPAAAMRPNLVTSYVVPSRVTDSFTSFGQLFAMKTAKHGGAMPA